MQGHSWGAPSCLLISSGQCNGRPIHSHGSYECSATFALTRVKCANAEVFLLCFQLLNLSQRISLSEGQGLTHTAYVHRTQVYGLA